MQQENFIKFTGLLRTLIAARRSKMRNFNEVSTQESTYFIMTGDSIEDYMVRDVSFYMDPHWTLSDEEKSISEQLESKWESVKEMYDRFEDIPDIDALTEEFFDIAFYEFLDKIVVLPEQDDDLLIVSAGYPSLAHQHGVKQ